jgi:hypothetical protein
MAIHCFFGDYTSHKNEKKMLDQLLTQLEPVYGGHEQWACVYYNAIWNGQEVDVVIVTRNAFIVGDFKNYSGDVTGQENGEWMINTLDGDTIPVKGGGQINPFVQVRKNRYAIMDWVNSSEILANDNMSHMSGLIIFTEVSKIKLTLSHSVNLWFHVSDTPHIAETIQSFHSDLINISEEEALEIAKALHLQKYNWSLKELVTPRYDPFKGLQKKHIPNKLSIDTSASTVNTPNEIKINPNFTKTRQIVIPFVLMVLICAILAYLFVTNYNYLMHKAFPLMLYIVPDSVIYRQ